MEQLQYGQSNTNLYLANARKVGLCSRDLQSVWFGEGGKMAYFRYLALASFGRCFTRIASLPKIGTKWLGPLDTCQKGR